MLVHSTPRATPQVCLSKQRFWELGGAACGMCLASTRQDTAASKTIFYVADVCDDGKDSPLMCATQGNPTNRMDGVVFFFGFRSPPHALAPTCRFLAKGNEWVSELSFRTMWCY